MAVALAAPLQAQDWKGMGRLFGKVTDATDNKPIVGATVKLDCPSRGGGTTLTTDKKGSWAFQGLAACNWNIDIKAEGYQIKSITVVNGSFTPLCCARRPSSPSSRPTRAGPPFCRT